MSGARTMRRMSERHVSDDFRNDGPRNSLPRAHSGRERRVSSQIQREVMQLILDRGLRAGAPLPTEAELMESLGVSRNSVREALKALQALDIVEIRHGYGTYVGEASLTPLIDGLTFRTLAQQGDDTGALAEILQVREVLEEGLVRRVVGDSRTASWSVSRAWWRVWKRPGRRGFRSPNSTGSSTSCCMRRSATPWCPSCWVRSGPCSAGSPWCGAGRTIRRPMSRSGGIATLSSP